jgi:hypothetical protein
MRAKNGRKYRFRKKGQKTVSIEANLRGPRTSFQSLSGDLPNEPFQLEKNSLISQKMAKKGHLGIFYPEKNAKYTRNRQKWPKNGQKRPKNGQNGQKRDF